MDVAGDPTGSDAGRRRRRNHHRRLRRRRPVDVIVTSVDYCCRPGYTATRATARSRTDQGRRADRAAGGINAIQTDYNNDGRLDIFVCAAAGNRHPQLAPAEQPGRHVHGRHTRGRPARWGRTSTHSVAWARLRQRRLAGRLRRARAGRASCSGQGRRDVRGCHRAGRRRARRRSPRAPCSATTTTTATPTCTSPTCSATTCCFTTTATARSPTWPAKLGVAEAAHQLPFVVLRLRQRRLARHLRGGLPELARGIREALLGRRRRRDADAVSQQPQRHIHGRQPATGLGRVVPGMGANFGDLDNDGFLDMYLGTGTPSSARSCPTSCCRTTRKAVSGRHDATGTGQLQKGHGIACGHRQRRRRGVVLKSAAPCRATTTANRCSRIPGPRPSLDFAALVGVKTNRAAIGAKIRVVLAKDSSGSSCATVKSRAAVRSAPTACGSTSGSARRRSNARIEWPVSRTTQVFQSVPIDTSIS